MNKIKRKLTVKALLLTIVISLSLSATISSSPVSAAVVTCAAGKNICSGTSTEDTCPTGYTKDASLSTEKTTCKLGEVFDDAGKKLVDTVQGILIFEKVLNTLIWPVLVMIGGLMDNSLLFGAGMQERLYSIWVPIRNLVNILFVIVLVGIALYNIVGVGDENSNYSLKSILPQIIAGIIIINFSFLGTKVVLDTVNVLTTSVFLIPGSVNEGLKELVNQKNPEHAALVAKLCASLGDLETTDVEAIGEDQLAKIQKDKVAMGPLEAILKSNGTTPMPRTVDEMRTAVEKLRDEAQEDQKIKYTSALEKSEAEPICAGSVLSKTGEAFLLTWNQRNAAFGLALNMAKIVFYEELPISIDTIDKTLVNAIMSLLLYFAFVGAFLALFVVLLARLVVLWLGIALSPIIILIYAAPSFKDKLGSIAEIGEQFLKNAIAPLIIALALTVGWIMLHALQGLNGGAMSEAFPGGSIGGLPVVGLSTIQDLITSAAVLGVVWVGVFSAAKGTIAEKFTDAIKGAGESAAKWVGGIPLKNINIVPVKLPGQDKNTHYSIADTLNFASRKFNDSNRSDALYNDFNAAHGIGGAVSLQEIAAGKVKPENAKGLVTSRRDDLKNGDQKTLQTLKSLKTNDPDVYKKLIEKAPLFAAAPDNLNGMPPEKLKEMGEELLRWAGNTPPITTKDLEGAAKTPAKPTEAAKPTETPPVKAAAVKTTVATTVAGKTITDIAAADPSRGTATQIAAKHETKRTELMSRTVMKSDDQGEIEKIITHSDFRPGGKAPTRDELQVMLGEINYNNLLMNLGNDNKAAGETALDAMLAKPITP